MKCLALLTLLASALPSLALARDASCFTEIKGRYITISKVSDIDLGENQEDIFRLKPIVERLSHFRGQSVVIEPSTAKITRNARFNTIAYYFEGVNQETSERFSYTFRCTL